MNNPLKIAGYAGIASLVLGFFSRFLPFPKNPAHITEFFLNPAVIIVVFFGVVLFFIHRYGTVVLAKRYNNRLLKIAGWLYIFLVPVVAVGLGVTATMFFFSALLGGSNPLTLALIYVTLSVLLGIFFIVFGIGYRKLKGQVSHAGKLGNILVIGGCLVPFSQSLNPS